MTVHLLLYESARWRDLRPMTDLTPVPALAFGASNLATRWCRTAGLPLLGVAARADAMATWSSAPPPAADPPRAGDRVLVIDAAALPGSWLSTALASSVPTRFRIGERIVGGLLGWEALKPMIGREGAIEGALAGLAAPTASVEARVIARPWDIVAWNAAAIEEDLAQASGVRGEVHPAAVVLEPARVSVEAGARVDPLAVLDARGGPILIAAEAVVLSHTVVAGPCVVGAGTQLLGGFVGRSTLGPQCRIAGEVDESVWQGYASKRHHGFVGHSLIGEWVNLGALTTTSDLKNNYGPVRVWVDGREIDTGTSKVGSFIGAHVKTGIGTLLPTGASVGVGSNLFGGGRFAPKHVPPFSWWDGERTVEHRWDQFVKTARIAMGRRGRTLTAPEESALRRWFETATEASGARTEA